MGRINHYEVFILAKRDGLKPKDICKRYDVMPQAIAKVVSDETWFRRNLRDPFAKTVQDRMVEMYEDKFSLDYRNGVTKLYRVLCRYLHVSEELTEESQKAFLEKVKGLEESDIVRIPGVSSAFALVIRQFIIDVNEGVFDDSCAESGTQENEAVPV